MKITNKIPCFCCDKELDNMEYEMHGNKKVFVHPMDGLHFTTHGHYGSTIFDPMDGTTLDIAICDDCVMLRKDKIRGNGRID